MSKDKKVEKKGSKERKLLIPFIIRIMALKEVNGRKKGEMFYFAGMTIFAQGMFVEEANKPEALQMHEDMADRICTSINTIWKEHFKASKQPIS